MQACNFDVAVRLPKYSFEGVISSSQFQPVATVPIRRASVSQQTQLNCAVSTVIGESLVCSEGASLPQRYYHASAREALGRKLVRLWRAVRPLCPRAPLLLHCVRDLCHFGLLEKFQALLSQQSI